MASTSRRRVLDTSHQCVDSESSKIVVIVVVATQNVPPLVFQFLFQIPHNCCVFYSIQSSHIVIIRHGRASAGIETVRTVVSFHRSLFLSSSLSSLLVLLLFREILLFVVFGAVAMRFGFAVTISLYFSSLPTKHHLTKKRSSHHHHPLLNNRYMDKKLKLKLNGNRGVIGILRGFDQFLNLVLDECVNDSTAEKTPLGMVVVRGASVLSMEALEHIAPVQRKSVM